MKKRFYAFVCLGAGIGLCLSSFAYPKPYSSTPQTKQQEQRMTKHASGSFEVKLTPQPDDNAKETSLGRMLINKQFHGDLAATSQGQMLAAMTAVKESAGYVALERVTGTLHGHTGSFALQHSGTMNRGKPQLSVTVVPDSGTDQLIGLTGKMTIIIADGKHSYEFEYSLTEQ